MMYELVEGRFELIIRKDDRLRREKITAVTIESVTVVKPAGGGAASAPCVVGIDSVTTAAEGGTAPLCVISSELLTRGGTVYLGHKVELDTRGASMPSMRLYDIEMAFGCDPREAKIYLHISATIENKTA